MARKNSADIASKWVKNLSGSTQSITDGVMRVTTNPAATAAARAPAYLAGVQAAVNSGKYARGLSRVTLQSWQDSMVKKGVPRIATGASEAKSKVQAFHDKWGPHMDALASKLQATPRGDLSTNIQRMITAVQHAADFKYTQ